MKAPPPVVAVIGAGTMGHGIAYVAALSGCDVRLTDDRADALPQAKAKIEDLLASGLKRGKLTEADGAAVRRRLQTEPTVRNAIADADVVIEAIVEDLAIKQRLFADSERAARVQHVLAVDCADCRRDETARPVDRDALLQSGACNEARGGGHPRTRETRRQRCRARRGVCTAARQGTHCRTRFARIRIQPPRCRTWSGSDAHARTRRRQR